MKPSIGLLGANGAGKTTIADYLVAEHGYRKLSFAEPLRELARLSEEWGRAERFYGYDEAKRLDPNFRQYLIDLGEGIRKWDPVYFVKALAQRITDMDPDKPWVIDDVRKQVEVNFLNDMGFRFIHVVKDVEIKNGKLDIPLTGVVLPTRPEIILTTTGQSYYKTNLSQLLKHAAWTLGGESADGSALVHEQRPDTESGGGSPDGGDGTDTPHWCERCQQERGRLSSLIGIYGSGRNADEGGRDRDDSEGLGGTPTVCYGQGDALCDHPARCGGVVLNPSGWPSDVRPDRL